jgi:hypothetical protein
LTKPNRRQTSAGTSGSTRAAADVPAAEPPIVSERPGSRPVTAGARGRRTGRRETARRRADRGTFLERHRSRLLTVVIALAVAVLGGWIFISSGQPVYGCSGTFDAAEPAPSGHLGAIQPDLGNRHLPTGAKATYTLCPPASGPHYNAAGFGPIEAGFYGPNDRSQPQGWVHNLEHGGLVVLYSCAQGACDSDDLAALRELFRGWSTQSAYCKVPARALGVVARFDDMPKPYAALLWGRVMYLDALDAHRINDFYVRDGEILSEDEEEFIVPPERQCEPPTPSASPSGNLDAGSPSSTRQRRE